MKNLKNKFLLFLLIGFIIISCKQEEIGAFSGKNQILFNSAYDQNQSTDSTLVSFGFADKAKKDTLVTIVVRTQGYVTDTDRIFDLKIADGSTAIQGTHYNIPKTLKVLKDSVKGYIPLTIYRTPDMKTKTFSLKMELVSNKNFETKFFKTQQRKPNTKPLSFTTYEVEINDKLSKPKEWDNYLTGYIGSFSIEKLLLFSKVIGVSPKNWFLGGMNLFVIHTIIFKNYLLEQKDKGKIIYEKDGREMTVGRYMY